MRKYLRLFPLLGLLAVLSSGVTSDAKNNHKTIPFDEIDFFFELNDTDEDLGVQLDLGAEPWKRLKIIDPCGNKIMDVAGRGSLKEFGLSSLFFESNEPNFEDMSKEEILELFPEGEYKFVGWTVEGEKLKGFATLTHDLPGAAVICEPEDGEEVDSEDVVVTWKSVTTPTGIKIESYQVIVTNDEDPRFEYNVRMPADANSLSVPAEFFEPGTEYELEILAVEESGNQTISVIFFETEED